MPSVRITNYTTRPLNTSLKHICALHFANEIAPGQTIKLKNVGKVWFTLEVVVDDGKNRYSIAASAACIAIVSIAAVATAAAAPVVATAAGVTASGAIVAAGSTVMAGFATALTTASSFIHAHAGPAAKISAAFLPKAIELVEKEVGGFNQVQKEVIAILSSPTVAEDVRKEGLSMLSRLGRAMAADRKAEAEFDAVQAAAIKLAEQAQDAKNKATELDKKVRKHKRAATETTATAPSHSRHLSSPSMTTVTTETTLNNSEPEAEPTRRPTLKRLGQSTSALLSQLSSEGRAEQRAVKKEAKEAKESASWEVVDVDDDMNAQVLSTKETLRMHGLYVGERHHFEIREKAGKLVLVDAVTQAVVAGEK